MANGSLQGSRSRKRRSARAVGTEEDGERIAKRREAQAGRGPARPPPSLGALAVGGTHS